MPLVLNPINGVSLSVDDFGNLIASLGGQISTAGFAVSYREHCDPVVNRSLGSFAKLSAKEPGDSGDLLPSSSARAQLADEADAVVRTAPCSQYQKQLSEITREIRLNPAENKVTITTRVATKVDLEVWASELIMHRELPESSIEQDPVSPKCTQENNCEPGSEGLLKLRERRFAGQLVTGPLLAVLPNLWSYGLQGKSKAGEIVYSSVYSVQK